MPLQFERRGQLVDAFVEHFHYSIVAAIDRDFAGPHRAPRLNLHSWVRPTDLRSAHPSKTFPHALENPRPIGAPLILIIVANKISDSLPVSVVDCVKEIFCVQPDLMLRSPQPHEIQPGAKGKSYPAIESATKCNRHSRNRRMLRRPRHFDRGESAGENPQPGIWLKRSGRRRRATGLACSVEIVCHQSVYYSCKQMEAGGWPEPFSAM
jgi:hypothetical protein